MTEEEQDLNVETVKAATLKTARDEIFHDVFSPSKEDLVAMADRVWHVVKDVVHTDSILERMESFVSEQYAKAEKRRDDLGEKDQRLRDLLAEKPDMKNRAAIKAYKKKLEEELKLTTEEVQEADDTRVALLFGAFLGTPDGQITAIGLSRWADNGYPQITMGHKFAAALLVTNVSADVLDAVKPPWDGFVIEVPDGLLEVYNNDLKRLCPIRRIVVSMHPNRHLGGQRGWMYIAFTDTSVSIWRFGVSTEQLLPPMLEGDLISRDPTLSFELTDVDSRCTAMIGRLIVNVCLAMSDPTLVKKIGPGHKAYRTGNRREVKEPITRTFQIGKPINLDFRSELREYIHGGPNARKKINVQVLVCGHYKLQPYGPKNSLRKTIWRAPFWRGPADAPILVRPHHMEKKNGPGTEDGPDSSGSPP